MADLTQFDEEAANESVRAVPLAKMKQPWRVALVTVTYNSAPVLDDFLGSLDDQSSTDWVLVAIDNASSDETRDRLARWNGPLHLIENETNRGFAAATNQGVEWARASGFNAVMLLNNDTAFAHDFLEQAIAFQVASGAPMVAPAVTYADRQDEFWFADGGFTWARGAFQAWMGEAPRQGPSWTAAFAPGCALLVAMEVFDRVGELDERFFVYWEDADFCLRCQGARIDVTVLAAPTIAHKVSALTGGASPFSVRMYQRNQILFLQKHFGPLGTWLQVPAIVAKVLFRWLSGRDDGAVTRLRLRTVFETLINPRREVPVG
jgi:GT2 family glycosyltransferase